MLKIEDLEVSYGAVQALRGISMEVNDGEIVSLIGANGAGKTTTLHAITGLVPIKSGSVIYDGHDLRKTDPSSTVKPCTVWARRAARHCLSSGRRL